ncbi:MAG: Gfo/Idh/MocA family oxidoreductase [Actinomycetia bacterium]|nr:Gfo/Idh/MocA family oxidoreductase [Actinomycetes bacterium]
MVKGEKVRVGVIGCGYWGPNFIRNLVSIKSVDLVGVCDSDEGRLGKVLEGYPHLRGTPDTDELINSDGVDALIIVTSASTHYELAKRAMTAGKHVFVEKPLSLKVAEGEELVEIAREKGLVLMVGHLLIYHPAVERMKEYVDSGELGDILYIYSQRLNLGKIRSDENCLWSIGPHDLSVMLYLLEEEPVEVAVHGMDYLQRGVEDVIFCNLKFPDDVIANLHISWLDPHKERKITVVGNKKMLVFDDMLSSEKLRIYDKGVEEVDGYLSFADSISLRFGDVLSPAVAMEEPLGRECLHFIDCVKEGSESLSGGEQGLKVLKVLEAAQRSLEQGGKPVSI